MQWDNPSLITVVYSLRQREMNYEEVNTERQKNFLQCPNYFDEKTAALVENGQDSFLYGMFGYDGCCKGFPMLTSNLTHPLKLDIILSKQSNYTNYANYQDFLLNSKDHLLGNLDFLQHLEEEVVIKDHTTKIDLDQSEHMVEILSQKTYLLQVIVCISLLLLLGIFGIRIR